MKRTTFGALIFSLFFFTAVQAQNQPEKLDSISYSLGVLMAQSLKDPGVKGLNWDHLAKGVGDVLDGEELLIPVEKANQIIQGYFQSLQAKKFEPIIKEGENFLAENGKRPEVTTLESGLQYEVLQAGDGPIPTDTNEVTVHYTGKLLDGTVFDSSVERGEPATFGVTRVIQGWIEALQLMPVGSKWRLFIPYHLGYGERGAGGVIGPYATLIFDVELLKIE